MKIELLEEDIPEFSNEMMILTQVFPLLNVVKTCKWHVTILKISQKFFKTILK